MTLAADIAVVYTPAGGYGDKMPPPILAGCNEPLSDGAPDLRGLWQVVGPEIDGETVPNTGQVRRIEQAGNRIVITSGGVIHDMFGN
jgi:hypothetical protein